MPKNAWSSGGIQKMKRSTTTVTKARCASASLYFMNRSGIRLEIQSRATKRAKENPTTLAASVAIIDSAKATGHGQINAAAKTKIVPGGRRTVG